jgi:hypothetical protein
MDTNACYYRQLILLSLFNRQFVVYEAVAICGIIHP